MNPSRVRRVYLSAGTAGLSDLADGGALPAVTPAFAVTAQARSAGPGLDEEELEYEAFRAAEDHLREAGEIPVVVSADVPAAHVVDEGDGHRVRLVEGVELTAVVCLHAAQPGAGEDEELLWYDATELPALAEQLRD